jgi:hypothetical protein
MIAITPEERIKRLEIEIMYMLRTIDNLCLIIEDLERPVEYHTHYVKVTENITCTACKPEQK